MARQGFRGSQSLEELLQGARMGLLRERLVADRPGSIAMMPLPPQAVFKPAPEGPMMRRIRKEMGLPERKVIRRLPGDDLSNPRVTFRNEVLIHLLERLRLLQEKK
jgi:hypothetical protein